MIKGKITTLSTLKAGNILRGRSNIKDMVSRYLEPNPVTSVTPPSPFAAHECVFANILSFAASCKVGLDERSCRQSLFHLCQGCWELRLDEY